MIWVFNDPVLDIAKSIEEKALNDEYFIEKSYILMLIFTLVLYIEPLVFQLKCLLLCLP